ncbi:MAG: hypothetical protein K2Y31_10890 [Burkholderiales bacterium]|jgi:hypothetical protein|nr:hypothetical protein [Burkholderiales bacterium]
MKYLLCLGLPLLLQAVLTLVFSQAGSGGSFVGLGALLFALLGIPLTLIINFALIRSYPALGTMAHFSRSFLLGLILPALQLALLITASILRW